ncbi:MAG: alpha/beta hydrolase fold [Geobacteraceae bacterium]|nr:MAG: alpha/beta hydrolase fold [Geobacteraceae bacterium]
MKIPAPLPLQPDEPDILFEYRENHRFSPGGKRLLTALIPCLTGIGCAYQALAEFRDRRRHLHPGRLVEVDGCRLHVQTAGNGSPAIVLEAGLGGMSSSWGWVQPEAAKFCRVVSYDRAGLGWSEADNAPQTARRDVRRLRDLLRISEIAPPYVLVGHSMGGLFTRVFADQHPDEVVGMVLVDAAHPEQHLRSPAIHRHMRRGFRMLKAIPLLTKLGYVRLTGFFNSWPAGLPPRQHAEAAAFLTSYRHLRSTRDESLAWEEICAEVRETRGLGNMPLAVVTAGKDVLPGHPELQRELAALSSNKVHVAVKGANHVTLVTHRHHALSVVEAIRWVVEAGSARQIRPQ